MFGNQKVRLVDLRYSDRSNKVQVERPISSTRYDNKAVSQFQFHNSLIRLILFSYTIFVLIEYASF